MRFLLLLGLIGSALCSILDFYNVVEGDILKLKSIPGMMNSALAGHHFKWPNATVPYTFEDAFSNEANRTIREAIDEIQNRTCVRFHEATESDRDRILIKTGTTPRSFVGRQGKAQDLFLTADELDRKTVLHELMHALGFVHEHNRADRDEYIDVILDNIQEDAKGNFVKKNINDLTLMDTPYSYNSVMHYGPFDFAKQSGLETFTLKKPGYMVGGEQKLSDIDVERINKLYCSQRVDGSRPDNIQGFNFQKGGGGIMWSNGCDFDGYDIEQNQVESIYCGDYCTRNSKCSHFTWSPNNGGICYLKGGLAPDAKPQMANSSFVCGYRGPTSSEGVWQQGGQGVWWSNGCDFSGNDITTVKTKPELCSDECMKRGDCTHFTWNPTDEGTCYLKKGQTEKPSCAPYFYVCGYIGRMGNGGPMLCT